MSGALERRRSEPALPLWQIGADGGFLASPVELSTLLLGPAERADVIVDFTGVREGTRLYLVNEAPDGPFRTETGGAPADPATTGQVMRFSVGPLQERDTSVPPDRLELPPLPRLGPATLNRPLALMERDSARLRGVGPAVAMLGAYDGRWTPRMWGDPLTENPAVGTTETWEFHNLTPDAHPMHIHEVLFEVVDRRPFRGAARPPEPGERGLKDTVIAKPQEITRVKLLFDRQGSYVWHCHLLEHEDNEMMRPYRIEA
ncbi:multicopper oxidase domain-containing protein [Sphaerisporangium perillae]|uniref:multicopper oxidase domain-containing protein n=1 Tax=Sphaerisporangium perillae TaxID=2935860 RepID=UPI00200F8B84|nr:multicopper oxidase domain-containing protein [Sphaerisporangium perillae]